MKILYDHQVFTWQNFGGISRYFYEVMKSQGDAAELSLIHSNNEYLCSDPKFSSMLKPKPVPRRYSKLERLFISRKKRRRATAMAEEINEQHSCARINAGQYDLFHPTYYDPYFLKHIGSRPFIVTVYDMIHELYPESFNLDDPASSRKQDVVRRATHVIAISHNTKKDLVRFFDIPESKVSVVHLGSSLLDAARADEGLITPSRYLLMVGNRGNYKNCYFAIRSLRELLREQPDLKIVCAGGGAFSDHEERFFANLGLAGRIVYYPASDENLCKLYQKAEAYIFPSLYEGFGIPVLEAFGCGCPVVASNTPALKEVAGDAAAYCDPKDMNSIHQAVAGVINNREFRAKLIKAGTDRLPQFSWEKCARETQAIYQEVIARSR